MVAAKSKSTKSTSSPSSEKSIFTRQNLKGHFVLYPSGGAFNKLRSSDESRYLHKLLDSNIQGYYSARSRRLYIIDNILSKIPGGLRVWDKSLKRSVLLEKEDAYRRVAQKIRDMKKYRPGVTKIATPPPPPPTRRAAKRKPSKVESTVESEPQPQPKKPKVVRKAVSKPAPKPAARAALRQLALRPKPPPSAPSVESGTRKSPMRDITPDMVKDELIVTLREEINRLRVLVRNQDIELHALRMLKGNSMLDGL